jgi:DNA repair protein RadC
LGPVSSVGPPPVESCFVEPIGLVPSPRDGPGPVNSTGKADDYMHFFNLRDQMARVEPGNHLALTDSAELRRALGALVGPKNAALALKRTGGRGLGRFTASELAAVCGFTKQTAERIVAARDFGRALNAPAPIAADAPAVLGFVPPDITALETEVMLGFALSPGLRVMASLLLAKGGVAGLSVTPRDIFTPLVRLSASAVVLVHNHPSGEPCASDQDIRFTREVVRAGHVLGIELIDHIIVAEGGFTSLATEGFIPSAGDRTLEGGLS